MTLPSEREFSLSYYFTYSLGVCVCGGGIAPNFSKDINVKWMQQFWLEFELCFPIPFSGLMTIMSTAIPVWDQLLEPNDPRNQTDAIFS